MLTGLTALFCLVMPVWSYDPYANQPRLESRNGHLLIIGASGANITLQTSEGGQININDLNILDSIHSAQEAASKIDQFAYGKTSAHGGSLNDLLNPLKSRLEMLEMLYYNSSTVTVRGSLISRIRLLTAKVNTLSKKVEVLRFLVETNECSSDPCQHGGTCQDLYNGYRCLCPVQWEGTQCQNDVDECVKFQNTDLGCQNGAICQNQPGSYKCVCADGWYGLHCTSSTRDCATAGGSNLCGNGICTDKSVGKVTQYVCMCNQGWTIDANSGGACTVDVDECSANVYPCSHDPLVKCDNLPGTFKCGLCPAGYVGNGYQCRDIDECITNNGGCSTYPFVQCINTRGSRVCGPCPPGYSGDGVNCIKSSNLCEVDRGGCHPLAECLHSPGLQYVLCKCPIGWSGSGVGNDGCLKDNRTVEMCSPAYCLNGGSCDQNSHGSISCVCLPYYTGSRCEIPISACSQQPCENGGTCVTVSPIFQTFKCLCEVGYTGSNCQYSLIGCGGTIKNETGSLIWPQNNMTGLQQPTSYFRCQWIIVVPIDRVLNISTKYYVRCPMSSLMIHDGRNSQFPSATLCGFKKQSNFTSTWNVVVVIFEANFQYPEVKVLGMQEQSFVFNWTSIPRTCGGSVNVSKHGSLSSPGSPGYYPHRSHCVWYLTAPLGKRIQIAFFSMDIESHPKCKFDYLKIYDGSDLTSPQLAIFCNSTIPPPIITSSPTATLEFKTDQVLFGRGFQLTYSPIEGVPGCGGIITSREGRIIPPQNHKSGGYVKGLQCEWRILLIPQSRVKLEFNEFQIESSSGCEYDRVEVYDGPDSSAKKIGRWCGSNAPQPIVSTKNSITVVFTSDGEINEGTFSIDYSLVCSSEFTTSNGTFSSPNYPNHYPSDQDCQYLIYLPPGNTIELNFIDVDLEQRTFFEEERETCLYDVIKVYDGDTVNSPLLTELCGNETSPALILSTHNYLLLVFTSDVSAGGRGFLANYSSISIGCGGILREKSGQITLRSQDTPSQMCHWVISAPVGKIVVLNWSSFILQQSVECIGDHISIYEGNANVENAHQLGENYCGSSRPPTMTSSSNIVMILLITMLTNHGIGVQPSFNVFYRVENADESCGGNFFSLNGMIQSPNYPNHYSSRLKCEWTITTKTNQQITLHFGNFSLERSTRCSADYLEIRNGGYATSPLIGTYCGVSIPEEITSFGNKLYLKFVTDSSITMNGFNLTFDGALIGCGGEIDGFSGSITSPNYPEPYGRNAECFWLIKVSQGSTISLTIVDIELEAHSLCLMDHLTIYDGDNSRAPLLGKYCYENNPRPIYSSRNFLFIMLRTDISRQGRGFHLKFNTVCHRQIKGYRGVIESPLFPSPFAMPVDCLWSIEAPVGNSFTIVFSQLKITTDTSLQYICEGNFYESPPRYCENANKCTSSFIEIDEGTSSNGKSLGKFCGPKTPPVINSTLNHIQVRSIAKGPSPQILFRLEWFVFGCGGDVKVEGGGEFHTPNFPGFSTKPTICEWTLSSKLGKSIFIQITTFELDMTNSNCDSNFLAVYGGPDRTSPILTKSCHSSGEITVHTSGNKAHVVFHFLDQGKYRFQAVAREGDSKCGGIFTAPEGHIYSPNYPQNYDSYDDCTYEIYISSNQRINISFIDFDVDSAYKNCSDAFVKVYDGGMSSSIVYTLCGSVLPKPIISTTDKLFIRHNPGNRVSKGFHIKYTAVCGAIHTTSESGVISYAEYFNKDTVPNCTWIVRSEVLDKKFTLVFTSLSFAPDSIGAKLLIYSGEDVNAPLEYKITGNVLPSSLEMTGSIVMIQLVTVPNLHVSFDLTYSLLDTACGSDIMASDGIITSPKYPSQYPPNVECVWTIFNSPGNSLILQIDELSIPSTPYCNENYIEVRSNDEDNKLIGTYCGHTVPDRISINSSLWIKFKSSSEIDKGFKATYSLQTFNELTGPEGEIQSFGYPSLRVTKFDHHWRVIAKVGSTINVELVEIYFHGSRENCTDRLTVYDGYDVTTPILTALCGFGESANIEPIKTTSNVVYIVYRASHNPARFALNWKQVDKAKKFKIQIPDKSNCSEVINVNETVTIRSPGYPWGYAPRLQCEWILTTAIYNHIELSFDVFDIEPSSKSCIADSVTLFDLQSDGEWKSKKVLCNETARATTFVGTKSMKLVFKTDNFGNRSGFVAIARSVCGGSINEPDGIVKMSMSLVSIAGCSWNISVNPGKQIEFSFTKFVVPVFETTASHCVDNFIILKEGFEWDSPIIGGGRFCNVRLPPKSMLTKGNRLSIFMSSGMSGAQEFELQFSTKSRLCSETYNLHKKSLPYLTITSPNYPNIPNAHSECTWTFFGPTGETIHLQFVERFDLGSNYDCEKEFVEVRDGSSELSPLIGKYCGSNPPSSVLSEGNAMFIKYYTDIDVPNNGFEAQVAIGNCGGTFHNLYVEEIQSPGYPNPYERGSNCVWHVKTNNEETFIITIKKLNLGVKRMYAPSKTCNNSNSDVITITATNRLTSNSMAWLIVGDNTTEPITMVGDEIVLNFTSVSRTIFDECFSGGDKVGFHFMIRRELKTCSEQFSLPYGELKTSGYPSAPRDLFCNWAVTVPYGRRITLNITDFEVDTKSGIFTPTLMIYNDANSNSLLAQYSETVPSGTIVSTSSNEMSIYFLNSMKSSHRGFRGYFSSDHPSICQVEKLHSTEGKIRMNINQPYSCQWNVLPNMATTTFTVVGKVSPNKTLGECWALEFAYNELTTKSFCGEATVNSPFTFITPYPSTLITARKPFVEHVKDYTTNYSISWKTCQCGGLFERSLDEAYVFSPNMTDGKYPANCDCVWIYSYEGDTPLKVKFDKLDLDMTSSGTGCSGDYLAIHGGPTPSAPQVLKTCGSILPKEILINSNVIWVHFHSDDAHESSGFHLTITQPVHACGGLHHGLMGNIESVNYPHQYPNNSECIYEIVAPVGYTVSLEFVERFYIQETPNCTSDFVEVSDYVKGEWKIVNKFCGRHFPNNINSTTNKMSVRFKSDGDVEGDGFKALWTVGCGGIFDASQPGIIPSPGYPDNYGTNLYCNYTFFVDDGSKLLYGIFEDFQLEQRGGNGCNTDKVEIYTPKYRFNLFGQSKLEGTYCGTERVPRIQSFRSFSVIFHSDFSFEFRGFLLKYGIETCGGNITQPSVIKADKSTSMRTNRNCLWNVTAPPGQIVVVKIQTLNLGIRALCSYQYLSIWDGNVIKPNDTNLIATLCGHVNEREGIYRTSSENALIRYYVGGFYGHNYPFAAEISFLYGPKVGCGGRIDLKSTEETLVQNPDVDKDGKYDPSMDCLWIITAPIDSTIIVKFLKIDIDNCTNPGNKTCHCDYVEMYDGLDENSELIGKYCGSSYPNHVSSSGSYLSIKFSSDELVNKGGFQVSAKAVESPCGVRFINVTEEVQTLTSPSYPSNYPANIHCKWILVSKYRTFVIHIEDVDIIESQGCSEDNLRIRDIGSGAIDIKTFFPNYLTENPSKKIYIGTNKENHSPGMIMGSRYPYSTSIFCGKRKEISYYSSTNYVMVKFQSSSSQTAKGFKLNYSIIGCRKNFTSPQGRIKVLNHRKSCTSTISVPNAGSTISLYFSSLSIYSWMGTSNNEPVFQIYDGDNINNPKALLAIVRGSVQRPMNPIFSNSSKVTIVINPDKASVTFDLTYTSTTEGQGCGGSIFNYGGIFTSPKYPMNLRNYTTCRWDVQVPVGSAIEIQFTEFDLGPKNTCGTDYVQIYDIEPNSGYESLQRIFCGNESPAKYTGLTGKIAVKYFTSIHNGGSGWVALFMSHAVDPTWPAVLGRNILD